MVRRRARGRPRGARKRRKTDENRVQKWRGRGGGDAARRRPRPPLALLSRAAAALARLLWWKWPPAGTPIPRQCDGNSLTAECCAGETGRECQGTEGEDAYLFICAFFFLYARLASFSQCEASPLPRRGGTPDNASRQTKAARDRGKNLFINSTRPSGSVNTWETQTGFRP